MNDDQLYYFLVDKDTRNVLQIEYPSDIDEFNKILGTSEGKGDLLKDLGIILNNHKKIFDNPVGTVEPLKLEIAEEPVAVEKPKKTAAKNATKTKTAKAKEVTTKQPTAGSLFEGLFD